MPGYIEINEWRCAETFLSLDKYSHGKANRLSPRDSLNEQDRPSPGTRALPREVACGDMGLETNLVKLGLSMHGMATRKSSRPGPPKNPPKRKTALSVFGRVEKFTSGLMYHCVSCLWRRE